MSVWPTRTGPVPTSLTFNYFHPQLHQFGGRGGMKGQGGMPGNRVESPHMPSLSNANSGFMGKRSKVDPTTIVSHPFQKKHTFMCSN